MPTICTRSVPAYTDCGWLSPWCCSVLHSWAKPIVRIWSWPLTVLRNGSWLLSSCRFLYWKWVTMWKKFFQDAASNFFVSRSLFNSNKMKWIINDVSVYYLGVDSVVRIDIRTPRRELKIGQTAEDFSWKFELQKLRSKRKSKMVKIYANYPNLLDGCDFVCFKLMEYSWVWEFHLQAAFWCIGE